MSDSPSSSSSKSSRQGSLRMKKLPKIQIRLPSSDITSESNSGTLSIQRVRRNTMDELPTKKSNPFDVAGSPRSARKLKPMTKPESESNSSLLLSERGRSFTTDSPATRSNRSNLFNDAKGNSLSTSNMSRFPISIGKRMDFLDRVQRENSTRLSQRSISSADTTMDMDLSQRSQKFPASISTDSTGNINPIITSTITSIPTNSISETTRMKPVSVIKSEQNPKTGSEKVMVDSKVQLKSNINEHVDSLYNCDIERDDNKPHDTPSSSTSEKKAFSLRILWSQFTTTMRNVWDAIDSHY